LVNEGGALERIDFTKPWEPEDDYPAQSVSWLIIALCMIFLAGAAFLALFYGPMIVHWLRSLYDSTPGFLS
jgi:hypothetical protein